MTAKQKLKKAIDSLQTNTTDKDNYQIIIGLITSSDSGGEPDCLLKDFTIDWTRFSVTYTTTQQPAEALLISRRLASVVIYHYFEQLEGGCPTIHYPVNFKLKP